MGFNGIKEIKNHFWFQKIKWGDLLKKKLECPFLPKNGDNFDKKFCGTPSVNIEEKIFLEKGKYEYLMLKEKCKRVFKNYDFVREEEKKHAMLMYNLKKINENKIGKNSSYIKVTLSDRNNNINKTKFNLNMNNNDKNKKTNLDLFPNPSCNNIAYNTNKVINTERLNSKNLNTLNIEKKKQQKNNFLKTNKVFCKKKIQKNINEINANNLYLNTNKNLNLKKINTYIDENIDINNFLFTNKNNKNNCISMKNIKINDSSYIYNNSNFKIKQENKIINRNSNDYVHVCKRRHNNNSMDNIITNYNYRINDYISKKNFNKNIFTYLININDDTSKNTNSYYLDKQLVYSPPHFQTKHFNSCKNSFTNSNQCISTSNENKNLSYNSNFYFSLQESNNNNFQKNNSNENRYTSLSSYLYKKNMASTAMNFNHKYKKNYSRPTCLYSNNQMMRDKIFLNDGSIDSYNEQANNSIIKFANKTSMKFNIQNNNFSKYNKMSANFNNKFQNILYKNNIERKKYKNISSENLNGINTQRISTYCNINNKENMDNNCNNSNFLREYTFRSKNKNNSLIFFQK